MLVIRYPIHLQTKMIVVKFILPGFSWLPESTDEPDKMIHFLAFDYFFMNDFRPLSMVTFLKSGDKK